ncbi:MAG: OmpA family protein [Acinetobacter sp.]
MRAVVISTLTAGALVLSGCQNLDGGATTGVRQYDKTAIGTLIGAAAGYGLSKSNANSSRQNNRAAAIGALVGAGAGLYLDNKEKKLRQQMAGTGVEVQRTENSVQLIMPGGVTFDTNKYNIKPNFYSTLNKVAQTLAEDNQSRILVTGYTDSTGTHDYNQTLSENRAQSVKSYLVGKGVSSSRIDAEGQAEANPIADNSTASGREQNRRVEISIYAAK